MAGPPQTTALHPCPANRILLAQAVPLAEKVEKTLKEIPDVSRIAFAGSFRRMKETIGDFDIILETDEPKQAIDFFTKNEDEIKEVISAGDTKASVKLQNNNFQVDVRVIPERSWGAALLYFTGSKTHNIESRTIAIKKGLRLNEYGCFKTSDETVMVAGRTEQEIYSVLGMDYIEPELRENRGEIQAAISHNLPKLVTSRKFEATFKYTRLTVTEGNRLGRWPTRREASATSISQLQTTLVLSKLPTRWMS